MLPARVIGHGEKGVLDSFAFRPATSVDDPRVLELLKSSFGRELSSDWWRWFSYDCPTGLNRTYLIEDCETKRLAASYSLLPIRIRLNKKEIKASLATNACTHPDYQGRGLFVCLGQFALAREREFDTRITLGVPNPNAYPGHMKVGWDVMCKLPFLVKHNCTIRSHRCCQVEKFDKRFDDFFAKIAEDFSFIVLKDHRFMNWRVSRPDQKYVKFVYEEESRMRGYVILKQFDEKGYRKSHILDIQAETRDALHELMAAAESFANGRDELNMWTNLNSPYHQIFLDYGFHPRESHDHPLIIHFNYGEKEPIKEGSWWICLADNDVY